jgi:hypothetical protein
LEKRTKVLILATAITMLLVVTYDKNLKSNYPLYIIGLIFLGAGSMAGVRITQKPQHTRYLRPGIIPLEELGNKEKKLLIFYILTKVEMKGQIDMSDIAAEIAVSIYDLNDIVKMLNKYKAIGVTYPPMHNFPIILKGDHEVSTRLRMNIFRSMTQKNILKNPKIEDFAYEVEEYLATMKRKKT